jgi:hypothetical protein
VQTDSAFVTVAVLGDLASAQLVAARLEAQGIPTFLPDELMAGQAWHLSPAMRGVRVQVPSHRLVDARAVLGAPPEERLDPDDGPTPGDRLAERAWKTAIVGFLLWPFLHPYGFWLSLTALRRDDLSAKGRRRARIGLVLCVLSLVALAYVAARLV